MKRLILMRHAKSDWSGHGSNDIERPLNKRGHRAAQALGDWLREIGLKPDEVLCSAATRTQQTLAGLALAKNIVTTVTRDLYLAEPKEMVAVLQKAKGSCTLMIGHNPGIAFLAEALVVVPPNHTEFARFPSGSTLVVDFDIAAWSALEMHSGTTKTFVVPRDLKS